MYRKGKDKTGTIVFSAALSNNDALIKQNDSLTNRKKTNKGFRIRT